ncbi:hypothetical protein T01_14167 [Trichinella spiralis]|uniref:Uncharacterized protein n=1 Tax=Trichinella spiralis TaxID=6334 RepID=A0A0V1BZ77_TRISP|nr:hypothetical protein T01_14167 [Trichinella spiralis]
MKPCFSTGIAKVVDINPLESMGLSKAGVRNFMATGGCIQHPQCYNGRIIAHPRPQVAHP